jgi:hypothetical protein
MISLERAGISLNSLCDSSIGIVSWNAAKLHSLVAHFLRVRFPLLLALNKCDIPSSNEFYLRIREELPHEPIIRTSASIEWWLQQHSNCIEIQDGKSVVASSNAPGQNLLLRFCLSRVYNLLFPPTPKIHCNHFSVGTPEFLSNLAVASHFFSEHKSTGVLEALTQVCSRFEARILVISAKITAGCVTAKTCHGISCG